MASGWQCARTCSALQAVRSESDQTADLPARWQILRRRRYDQTADLPLPARCLRRPCVWALSQHTYLDLAPRQRLKDALGTLSQKHCNPADSGPSAIQLLPPTNIHINSSNELMFSTIVYIRLYTFSSTTSRCNTLFSSLPPSAQNWRGTRLSGPKWEAVETPAMCYCSSTCTSVSSYISSCAAQELENGEYNNIGRQYMHFCWAWILWTCLIQGEQPPNRLQ
jgi:hypothetical protein